MQSRQEARWEAMGRLTETACWKRCVPRARLPIAEYLFPIFLSVPFSLDIVTDTAYKLPLSVTNCQTSDEKRRGGRVTELALLGFKIGPWDFYRGRGLQYHLSNIRFDHIQQGGIHVSRGVSRGVSF